MLSRIRERLHFRALDGDFVYSLHTCRGWQNRIGDGLQQESGWIAHIWCSIQHKDVLAIENCDIRLDPTFPPRLS